MKTINQNGQILSYDILLAAFILFSILIFSLIILNNNFLEKQENVFNQKIRLDALNFSEIIFSDGNCLEFGLVNGKRKLSYEKIDCVNNLDYEILKSNISADGYDFYLILLSDTQTILEKGIKGDKQAVSIQRFGELNGEIIKGVFILYEK